MALAVAALKQQIPQPDRQAGPRGWGWTALGGWGLRQWHEPADEQLALVGQLKGT